MTFETYLRRLFVAAICAAIVACGTANLDDVLPDKATEAPITLALAGEQIAIDRQALAGSGDGERIGKRINSSRVDGATFVTRQIARFHQIVRCRQIARFRQIARLQIARLQFDFKWRQLAAKHFDVAGSGDAKPDRVPFDFQNLYFDLAVDDYRLISFP